MSESNGTLTTNGDTALLTNEKDWRLVEDLKILRRAALNRWDVPPQLKRAIVERIDQRLSEGSLSDRALFACAQCLAAFDKNDLAALALLDKIHRLDTGGATENVQQAVRVIIERDDA